VPISVMLEGHDLPVILFFNVVYVNPVAGFVKSIIAELNIYFFILPLLVSASISASNRCLDHILSGHYRPSA
jgi:hypothetical protein